MATNYSNVLLRFDGSVSIASGSSPVKVKGSNGADTVTIEKGVEVVLDGSFNRGNDVINFDGLASSYSIVRLSSSSILVTDALGTSVTIPVGSAGTTLQFADASRELTGSATGITLGTQAVTTTAAAVAAGTGHAVPFAPNGDVGTLPGANPNQSNVVILSQGANFVLGDHSDPTTIRGSNSADTVTIQEGSKVVLDGSFNRGNDTIILTNNADQYEIVKLGSSSIKITDMAGTSVTIPVGSNGTTIQFADASRELAGSAAGLFLGSQQITAVATDVAAGESATGHVFTLQEVVVTPAKAATEDTQVYVPAVKAVYWGYNTEDGNSDHGVPVATLLDFVSKITGLDFAELGLIDDKGNKTFDNVANLSITNALTLTAGNGGDGGAADNTSAGGPGAPGGTPSLVIDYTDGSTAEFEIEVQLGDMYLTFLRDLLFDESGASRLYEKVITPGGYVTVKAGEDAIPATYAPIKLTTSTNNGGTLETGTTGRGDDTIVVGRLELLHQAYIDGGPGYNTLEIDAKGTYAQPTQLLNIQEIRVNDLPNFYTTDYGSGVGNLQNTLVNSSGFLVPEGDGSNNSWLDLSRATQLEKLVISDQVHSSSESTGDLTIVGVQNGAVLRLEGGFDSECGNLTVQYADVSANGLTVELNVGTIDTALQILQSSATLNLVSEGVANHIETFFGGGLLSHINISGTGQFSVGDDLGYSLNNDAPTTIDASTNTGGVTLSIGNYCEAPADLTYLGSKGNDNILIGTSDNMPTDGEALKITDLLGNNHYDIYGYAITSIALGDGANHLYLDDSETATITAGNGANNIEAYSEGVLSVTVGNGANTLELGYGEEDAIILNAGNGNNTVYADAYGKVNITAGSGTNTVTADGSQVAITLGNAGTVNVTASQSAVITSGNGVNSITVDTGAYGAAVITTGTANDTITATGKSVTINSAGGADTITLKQGTSTDYVDAHETGGNSTDGTGSSQTANGSDGMLMKVTAGTGSSITIGADSAGKSVSALSGSFITGQNLTLKVASEADLHAATLTGITSVVMDDDNFDATQSPSANEATAGGNAAVLTLTASQFKAIGAANFTVDGAAFNTHSFLKIIVDSTTSLTALGVDSLPRNIDLILEVQDGVTLTMTAQQLHERVAQEGVILAGNGTTDSTDLANGKVIITGAGQDFDPFNTTDKVESVINGRTYYGGSLSEDFKEGDVWYNVTLKAVFGGYDRPADVVAVQVLTIDSNVTADVTGINTHHTNLEMVGDKDINFTGAIQLGMKNVSGTEVATNPFTIDFSKLEGDVNNMVVDNFELLAQGTGGIYGNADAGYNAEVLISIAADEADNTVGFDEEGAHGLVSKGVTKYTVTQIDGPTAPGSTGNHATLLLCDTTQDLEVLALRGNWNDTLIVEGAAWGLKFELEGGSTAKADGNTATSNVGQLDATFQWPGASAVVDLVHSVAGDTRPLYAAGITINNASSLTVNSQGSATIAFIEDDGASGANPNDLASLDLNASGNLTITDPLPSDLHSIDAAGVTGKVTLHVDDPTDGKLSIVGAAGSSAITLDGPDAGDITSISGAGAITLTIEDSVNLTKTTLTNVHDVVLTAGSTLSMTMAQADLIGASHFSAPTGAGATLNLAGLADQVFAIANYDVDITTINITIAGNPTVTLNDATSLKGIAGLEVPAGTVLTLTAAQYQQLTGAGAITGVGGTTNFTVHITHLDQAALGTGFDLSGITADHVTVDMSGDVVLHPTDDLGTASFTVNNWSLTLGLEQADGHDFTGGPASVLRFTDRLLDGDNETNDASGFNVGRVELTATLTQNCAPDNIDAALDGIPQAVVKGVYQGLVGINEVNQTVDIEAGVTVTGGLEYNPPAVDTELQNFTINLLGGASIEGDLNLSSGDKFDDIDGDGVQDGGNPGEPDLLRTYLRTLTINSSGTAANAISNLTANYIHGDVYGDGNNILDVTINATQKLVIEGDIIFNSTAGEDDFSGNDQVDAIAKLTVTGSKDVVIGGVDLGDTDVDGLNLVNNGTGKVQLSLDGNLVGAAEKLSFTGTGAVELTVDNDVNLSGDTLTAVSKITISEDSLTLTQAQFDALGATHISAAAGTTLNLVSFGSGAFDATGIDSDLAVNITLADANVTLNGNFTGVDSIHVQEGRTLTLTADQYMQLIEDGGTISDAEGDTTDFNVVITGLTNAHIAAGFDVGNIDNNGGTVTISLGEASVDLGTFNSHHVVTSVTNIETNDGDQAVFTLTNGQTLGLTSYDQANGLDVNGTGTTTITYKFLDWGPGGFFVETFRRIDASGYNVTDLRAMADSFTVAQENVEFRIEDLASSVTLTLYDDPADLGFLDATHRYLVIEPGVVTPTNLIFNDPDTGDELRTLDITLQGGSQISGDIRIPTMTNKVGSLIQQYFDTLTIHSTGTSANTIADDINTQAAFVGTWENNLLKVVIDAQQDLTIGGDIVYNSVFSSLSGDMQDLLGELDTASLTISGSGDVTIQNIRIDDSDIIDFDINLTGFTGVLDPNIYGDGAIESIHMTNGDVADGDAIFQEVDADSLSTFDASHFDGNLTIENLSDIAGLKFTFTAGAGLNNVTLTDEDLTGSATGKGWTFDFSAAGTGSEFHIDAEIDADAGENLTIKLGSHTTLYIDADNDWSALDLSILNGVQIVVADGVTLTLSAAQASGLHIVGADATPTGVVNIVGLQNDTPTSNHVYDFSGIAANVSGTVTLAEDDVTLDPTSNLGGFTVVLDDIGPDNSFFGQTIRFTAEAQAERAIRVGSGFYNGTTDTDTESSANVVWLFTSITDPNGIDTTHYDAEISRLFLNETLINNESGDVENLFTTLPSTVLRVDFATLEELQVLLSSSGIDRTVEFASFTNVGDLTFSDVGVTPQEHIQNLTLKLGGEVTVGDIVLDDVLSAPGYDGESVQFDTLLIESHRALSDADPLAPEAYVNNNDGTTQAGEHRQPINLNTIGDINVGGSSPEIDLMDVTIDVGDLSTVGDATVDAWNSGLSQGSQGANISIGTITFDSEVAGSEAQLTITGENDVTIAAINTADPDITGIDIDLDGFSGSLDPVMHVDKTEYITVHDGLVLDGAILNRSDATFDYVEGDELSSFDANNYSGDLTVVLSQMDSTNDDSTPASPANDGLLDAFTFDSGTGLTHVTVKANGSHVPTLAAGSTWDFNMDDADPDSTLTFDGSIVLEAGSRIVIHGSNGGDTTVNITGDLDVSQVIFDAGDDVSKIYVGAGASLTISVEQALALTANNIEIVGEGTVYLTGDATDENPGALGAMLHTATVDASAVTIDTTVDSNDTFDLILTGARTLAGAPSGQTVIGSNFDDFLVQSAFGIDQSLNFVMNGGQGDDVYIAAGLGDFTYISNSGDDVIGGRPVIGINLAQDPTWTDATDYNDVINVGAGASITGFADGFYATSATSNAGEVNLTAWGTDVTLDLSLASGPNGYNLNGYDSSTTGNETLIGSAFNDVLNGGNDAQSSSDAVDTLTGNAGADTFAFNLPIGSVATFSQTTTTTGIDREVIALTADDTDNGNEQMVIDYTVNGQSRSVTITFPSTDVSSLSALRARVVAVLDALPDIHAANATLSDQILISGDNGKSIEITSISISGTTTTLGGDNDPNSNGGEGTIAIEQDRAQVIEVTVGGTPHQNDLYTLTISEQDGAGTVQSITAGASPTADDIASGFSAALSTAIVNDGASGPVLTLTDADADDGSFSVSFEAVAALNGSGASDLLSDPVGAGDYTTADVVTDFNGAQGDTISFDLGNGSTLGAGTVTNYAEHAAYADYAAAQTGADDAFAASSGALQYFLTSTADFDGAGPGTEGGGLLFVDANLDGSADLVVILQGIDQSSFQASYIV